LFGKKKRKRIDGLGMPGCRLVAKELGTTAVLGKLSTVGVYDKLVEVEDIRRGDLMALSRVVHAIRGFLEISGETVREMRGKGRRVVRSVDGGVMRWRSLECGERSRWLSVYTCTV
jgi:hypothetical protein